MHHLFLLSTSVDLEGVLKEGKKELFSTEIDAVLANSKTLMSKNR